MRVLVACEESQRVCIEFRKLGHEAYSCDIQECSGGHPEWHIMQNAIPILNGDCNFKTCDNEDHTINGKWDLIVAHPPCTYLTCAGNKWYKPEYKNRFPERNRQRELAIQFFMDIWNADCKHIAIENPQGIMSKKFRKPDQYIEPYYFGDPEKKKTGLWLRGLPLLKPTNIVEPIIIKCKSGANEPRWHMETIKFPPKDRQKERSKTFIGIAKAMATQYSMAICNPKDYQIVFDKDGQGKIV